MGMDNSAADEIINIDIDIDDADLEPTELDEVTRDLAESLRNLPHETVGIITDPTPASPAGAAPAKTSGVVIMSLKKAILPKVLELVQQESLACNSRRFTISGPDETRLDCTGTVSAELVTAWLNGVTKKPDLARS